MQIIHYFTLHIMFGSEQNVWILFAKEISV